MALTDFSEPSNPQIFHLVSSPFPGTSLHFPASVWPGGCGYKVYGEGLLPASNLNQLPLYESSCTMLPSPSFLLFFFSSQILRLTVHHRHVSRVLQSLLCQICHLAIPYPDPFTLLNGSLQHCSSGSPYTPFTLYFLRTKHCSLLHTLHSGWVTF